MKKHFRKVDPNRNLNHGRLLDDPEANARTHLAPLFVIAFALLAAGPAAAQYDSYGADTFTEFAPVDPAETPTAEAMDTFVLNLDDDRGDQPAGYTADVLDLARNKLEWNFGWTADGRHQLSLEFVDDTGEVSTASIEVSGESGESLEILTPSCFQEPCPETPAAKIMQAVAANTSARMSSSFVTSTGGSTGNTDWLDCMTACMADNDPIDAAIEAAIGYLMAGQLPKTLVASIADALGDHQLARTIRMSLRNPAASRFTTFPRSLQAAMRAGGKAGLKKVAQAAGRYVGPVLVAYGLYLAAVEFHCAGVCSACWWYGVPYDSSMRMSESFKSYLR